MVKDEQNDDKPWKIWNIHDTGEKVKMTENQELIKNTKSQLMLIPGDKTHSISFAR